MREIQGHIWMMIYGYDNLSIYHQLSRVWEYWAGHHQHEFGHELRVCLRLHMIMNVIVLEQST